jgi:hypothetical protein
LFREARHIVGNYKLIYFAIDGLYPHTDFSKVGHDLFQDCTWGKSAPGSLMINSSTSLGESHSATQNA